MTETEIIKLVFGLFLGVGGGVLLLLAFTVGYRYLVMERRCTCRTNGTVTGYSAASYGGEGSAVHLPVVSYTVEGQQYRVTGPRYRGYVSRTVRTPLAGNACRCYEKNGVLHIERSRNSIIGVSRNPMAEQYPVGTVLPVWFDPQKPQRSYVLRCPDNRWIFWLLFLFGLVTWIGCALILILL